MASQVVTERERIDPTAQGDREVPGDPDGDAEGSGVASLPLSAEALRGLVAGLQALNGRR
jgi:hypothetical protein